MPVTNRVKAKFIVVGLGSIGKVHLSKVVSRSEKVIVIDRNLEILNFLKSNPLYKKVVFHAQLESVQEPLESYTGIIANWGPDHFSILEELHRRGVRHFVVEKPLVSKLSDLYSLSQLVKNRALKVITNLPISFGPLPSLVSSYEANEKIGKVKSIVVSGGAKCLVTNGIHYVSLASKIFNSNPESVVSLLDNQPYNPRSQQFLFMGGVSIWEFSEHRHLTVSFSNDSHVQLVITVIHEFGKIVIEGDIGTVYYITENERAKIDKPSRTFYARQVLETFTPYRFEGGSDGMDEIYKALEMSNGPTGDDFEDGFNATEAVIGMLISSEMKALVELPLQSEVKDKYNSREWNIS